MHSPLTSLEGHSKTLFIIAGILLIFNALGAALNTFADMPALGQTMKEIFQSAGYGLALLGGLALYPTLARGSKWLARSGGFLAALGVIGGSILTVAYILEALLLLDTVPGWANAMGAAIGLGQLGLALLGIAALRSDVYSVPVALTLFGPMLVFLFFILGATFGAEDVPAYVPFLTVSAQTIAHLIIAYALPRDPAQVGETRQQELSAA